MSVFTSYEVRVLQLLAGEVVPVAQLDSVVQDAVLIDYDYTGSGYYMTVSHPSFPSDPVVCAEPIVMGHSGSIDCGFVLHFGGEGRLTVECHTWGPVDVPEDFRTREVDVEIATHVMTNKPIRSELKSPNQPPQTRPTSRPV